MQNSSTEKSSAATAEPQTTKSNPTFKKRIRTTDYTIGVHFSTTAKESINDKVLRLIKGDIVKSHEPKPQ